MEYPGYRVVLNTLFGRMRDKVQIDIGIGDSVDPLIREIPFVQYRGKPLFESAVSLQVYPVETIFSEKLETVLSKGIGNSRMKDYHDLVFLIRNKETLDLDKLRGSVESTFANRGTFFSPIEFDEASCKILQKLWTGHCQGLGDNTRELKLPQDILFVIEAINEFVSKVF